MMLTMTTIRCSRQLHPSRSYTSNLLLPHRFRFICPYIFTAKEYLHLNIQPPENGSSPSCCYYYHIEQKEIGGMNLICGMVTKQLGRAPALFQNNHSLINNKDPSTVKRIHRKIRPQYQENKQDVFLNMSRSHVFGEVQLLHTSVFCCTFARTDH